MENLQGRVLTWEELTEEEQAFVQEQPSAVQRFYGIYHGRCQRCLNDDPKLFAVKPCVNGHGVCCYCLDCLAFSRISTCTRLVHVPACSLPQREIMFNCDKTLSTGQERISQEMLASLSKGEDRLIWAVTGAGKTEMTFASIHAALQAGQRVAYASPRIDVCMDLRPRYAATFPDEQIPLLYGGSQEPYHWAALMMMTTHQLVRFYKAFDVLIIDEPDAFPFNGSALLERAVKKAAKDRHSIFWLTATPSAFLVDQVKAGDLPVSILPGRFHGYPLVVPTFSYVGNWRKKLSAGQLPRKVKAFLAKEVTQKQFCLVFMPHIPLMKQLEALLKQQHPDWRLTSVSSQDPERLAKVKKAKEGAYDLLLTTTILERGVTFYAIDVAVLGAEDQTFTSESLIQIAGRVGRHKDSPSGQVIYWHEGQTQAMRKARATIRLLNRCYREGRGSKDDVLALP